MIGWLQGKFLREAQGGLMMNVNQVGYLVFASNRTLSQIPRGNEIFSLHIETHVREDHIHLYGFYELDEQDMFKLLLTVQGVGAKMALALLSTLSPEQIRQAIIASDKAMLTKADGVGPKLAIRMITELKDKPALSGGISSFNPAKLSPSSLVSADNSSKAQALHEDVISALSNLGYGRAEAYQALVKSLPNLEAKDQSNIAKLISASLKELGQS